MNQGSRLLAFDFDGTLAPIQEDPSTVRIDRAAAALIAQALRMPGVSVAIVSGRDVDDVSRRVNAFGAYIVGSHGLEIRGPGGMPVRDTPPLAVALDGELELEISARRLRLERKKHALALHWRGVPLDGAGGLVDRFRAWAVDAGLELIEGRCVVEARTRGGGKEEALRWLANAIGAGTVFYAGDDVTDFGPLRFAAERGRGVFVASDERTAPEGVTVVGSPRELYRLIRSEVML